MKEATLKQASQFLSLVADKDPSVEEGQAVFGSGLLSDVFDAAKSGTLNPSKRDDIRELLGLARLTPKPGTNVFSVMVDFGQTLEEMIAAGHYDWKNDDITAKRFPVKGEGKKTVEITLVHFNRVIESDEAIKEMDAQGYRPATIEELLALGKEQPDLQRSFPIIALGSVGEVNGYRPVPYLNRFGS